MEYKEGTLVATNVEIVKVDSTQFQAALAQFKTLADTLVVKDAATCLAAKTAQRDVRNYMKDVTYKLKPFVDAAKQNYDKARDELNRWLDPAKLIDETLASNVKDYETQERLAAEAEQRRINDERRKKAEEEAAAARKIADEQAEAARKKAAAEAEAARKAGEIGKREAERLKKQADEAAEKAKAQAEADAKASVLAVKDVTVKPEIPTVAGVPSRRNWRWEVVDESKIPEEFWMLNEMKIGAEVRTSKEKTNIPGVRAYQE